MYIRHFILCHFLTLCFQLLAFCSGAQQLKLGNNPTVIDPSAVLQLDSKNQGLLLTRISDTDDIVHPSNGMIIYFTDTTVEKESGMNAGVYERRNGHWYRSMQSFDAMNDPDSTNGFYYLKPDRVTLNIRDASGSKAGLVNTSESHQTFYGDKTFLDSLVVLKKISAMDLHISDSLILGASKNTSGYTSFLTTRNSGKIQLADMDKGYWKVGGDDISSGAAVIGKKNETSLSIVTHSQDRIRITSDGKAGIGTPAPTDTLDVSGSFKLGKDGSSFERMGEGVIGPISFGGGVLNLTPQYINEIDTFTLNGVKENALIFVNPTNNLYKTSEVKIVITLGLSTTGATIMWARAFSDNRIEIALQIVKYTPVLGVAGLVFPTITTKFDVLYCNPE